MFKMLSSVRSSATKAATLMAVLCIIALGASACQINISSALTPTLTPTPTSQTDFTSLDDPTATTTATPPVPTEDSGSDSGDADDSDDVCPMISQDEAGEVLGQTVTSITPGTDDDSITGQTLNFCTYLGQGLAVVLSVVDTGSLNLVGPMLNQMVENNQDEDEVPSITEWLGLGDQAFWQTTSHAGGFIVQTGTVVFSLVVGGNVDDPSAYREALLRLGALVVGRF
jgi:hypothetical protein